MGLIYSSLISAFSPHRSQLPVVDRLGPECSKEVRVGSLRVGGGNDLVWLTTISKQTVARYCRPSCVSLLIPFAQVFAAEFFNINPF